MFLCWAYYFSLKLSVKHSKPNKEALFQFEGLTNRELLKSTQSRTLSVLACRVVQGQVWLRRAAALAAKLARQIGRQLFAAFCANLVTLGSWLVQWKIVRKLRKYLRRLHNYCGVILSCNSFVRSRVSPPQKNRHDGVGAGLVPRPSATPPAPPTPPPRTRVDFGEGLKQKDRSRSLMQIV